MFSKENTGGRLKKQKGLKKTYKVTAKMSTGEYYQFLDKAKKANLNKSEFIRTCISNSRITERISIEHQSLVRKLCGMANNLNQVARQANAGGFVTVYKEMITMSDSIDGIIKMIRNDS